MAERSQQNQRHQEGGEQHEQQAQPVHPDVEADARRGNPRQIYFQLTSVIGIEGNGSVHRDQKLQQRRPEGEYTPGFAFNKVQQQRRGQGEEKEKSCKHYLF